MTIFQILSTGAVIDTGDSITLSNFLLKFPTLSGAVTDAVQPMPNPYATWNASTRTWVRNIPAEVAAAASAQNTTVNNTCNANIATDISFTTQAGVSKTFWADPASINELTLAVQSASLPGQSLPANFYWKATDGTQVPFTITDLQNLLAAYSTRRWNEFASLETKLASIAKVAATPVWSAQTATQGEEILDNLGNVWKCTTGGATSTTMPVFPASPAAGATVADGAAVWTYVNAIASIIKAII